MNVSKLSSTNVLQKNSSINMNEESKIENNLNLLPSDFKVDDVQQTVLKASSQSLIDQQQIRLLNKNNYKEHFLKKAFTNINSQQKNDDFKRIFKDISLNEPLLIDFSCALQRDILFQGRLFVTMHHICFYSNILGWETNIAIKFKNITNIQKNKTAKIIPNAIKIRLENDKYVFTSLAARDKTYEILYKIWQKELKNDSFNINEIKLILRNSFIEELGYNSERDDIKFNIKESETCNSLNRQSSILEDKKKLNVKSQDTISRESSFDGIEVSVAGSQSTVYADNISKSDCIYLSTHSIKDNDNLNDTQKLDNNNKLINNDKSNDLSNNSLKNEVFNVLNENRNNNNNNNDEIIVNVSLEELYLIPTYCECKEHLGKEMLNQNFNLSPNYIFECIFGNTGFSEKYWESRKFFDMKISEWRFIDGHQERQLDFNVAFSNPVGPKQFKNSERQKLLQYIPNKCVVVESASVATGVPYSNYFIVRVRFCMTRVDKQTSNLKIHTYVDFIQKPFGIIKTFIEKNTIGALVDAYKYLNTKLGEEKETKIDSIPVISAVKNVVQESNIKETIEEPILTIASSSSSSASPETIKKHKVKRRKQSNRSDEYSLSKRRSSRKRLKSVSTQSDDNTNTTATNNNNNKNDTNSYPQMVPIQTFSFFKWQINVDTLVRLFIIAMVFLMMINGILYLKLIRIENFAKLLNEQAKSIHLSNNSNLLKESNNLLNEQKSYNLEEAFLNTAKAISKMGQTINDWTHTFEKSNNTHNEKTSSDIKFDL